MFTCKNQVYTADIYFQNLKFALFSLTPSIIGFVMQYLYAPQIHFNLAGKPISFIGNLSNKMGKFSLIMIVVTFICPFPYIKDKATMDVSLNHGDNLPKELLSKTGGNDFKEHIVGTLIPNFLSPTLGKIYPMMTSVTMKSRQNLFVWALDMNYGPTLPMMPSRNWTTSLVSWRKSNPGIHQETLRPKSG
jgi:hypothetical protein